MKIGILGGGQLGRMLALAGYPLGLRLLSYDPSPEACAGHLTPLTSAGWDDLAALRGFAAGCDAVTYEFENVPLDAARAVAEGAPLRPGLAALETAQDRCNEKTLFGRLGIATAPWRTVDSLPELRAALAEIGLPAILKTRRLGYDGKGQAVIREAGEAEAAWRSVGGAASIVEGMIHFDYEVSLIAVRGMRGCTAFYPLSRNHHEGGILRLSRPIDDANLQQQAQNYAIRLLDALDHVGVLTIEFFVRDGELLGNELAPRVHNSGHWTIEGAQTSQFENHLRAVAALPLGGTAPRGHCAMVNFIGQMPPREKLLALPWLHLHDYAKQPATGRKVGHATLCAPDAAALDAGLKAVEALRNDG